ncbi:MAG: tetratricopeptide repeat protein [Parachlamydiaceae bacterium]|nr:MAG: tetratricopeptide repeat protein [Parachlamydiaceae bacterium]
MISTPLKTEKQIKAQLREAFNECFNEENLIEFYRQCHELIYKHLQNCDLFTQEKIKNEFLNIKIAVDWDSTSSFRGLQGLSDETLLVIYQVALNLFETQRFDQSKQLLSMLLLFASKISSYWNALGYVYQTEGNFESAITCYSKSLETDPDNIETYFYLARCYLQMQQSYLAKQQLDNLREYLIQSNSIHLWENHIIALTKEINLIFKGE